MTDPVLFEKLGSAQRGLGLITLNAEATLNSLSLDMVDLLLQRLARWQRDPEIAAVLIQGAGDKSFSAGGDIQFLYAAMANNNRAEYQGRTIATEFFFEQEYRLDYFIHHYPKPIIAWGQGIIMGGGFGVYANCRHRVVTETTRIAMPEVGIGLFPDVGASFFLNLMPGELGRFLALTGNAINASESLYSGIADHFCGNNGKAALMDALLSQPWSDLPEENHALIEKQLNQLQTREAEKLPPSRLLGNEGIIDKICAGKTLLQFAEALMQIDSEEPWLLTAREKFQRSSPLALCWSDSHLSQCKALSYRDVLQKDLVLATNITRHSEFGEGIRAQVIDKDRRPRWQYGSIAEVPEDLLNSFFEPPWPENPLSNL